MAVTQSTARSLVEWCLQHSDFTAEMVETSKTFFALRGSGWGSYLLYELAEDESRTRRFGSWFALTHRLPSGELPAEVAARHLLKGKDLRDALQAIAGARFVSGRVDAVRPGVGVLVDVMGEKIEVRGRDVGGPEAEAGAFIGHIIPDLAGHWVPGPGWIVLPSAFAVLVRDHVGDVDPIDIERVLQGRGPRSREREAAPGFRRGLRQSLPWLSARAAGPRREVTKPEAYLLRVTLESIAFRGFKNVYREIEITSEQTLEDLHGAIQGAFGWDNDHLYAFWMSGKYWDRDHSTEFVDPREGEGRKATIKLSRLGLGKGQRFVYLFDFGDELRHRILVRQVMPIAAGAEYPRVVKEVGEAPSQYGVIDDWEDDDREDEEAEDEAEGEIGDEERHKGHREVE